MPREKLARYPSIRDTHCLRERRRRDALSRCQSFLAVRKLNTPWRAKQGKEKKKREKARVSRLARLHRTDSSIGPGTTVAELSVHKKPMKRRANGTSYSCCVQNSVFPRLLVGGRCAGSRNKRLRLPFSFFLATIFIVMNVSDTVVPNGEDIIMRALAT